MKQREYSVNALREMSDKELAREKSFIGTMIVVWTHLCPPLEAVKLNRESGYFGLANVILAKHLKLSRAIEGAKTVLRMIEEEDLRRGVL